MSMESLLLAMHEPQVQPVRGISLRIIRWSTVQVDAAVAFFEGILGVWLLVVDAEKYSLLFRAFNSWGGARIWGFIGIISCIISLFSLVYKFPKFRKTALKLNLVFWGSVTVIANISDVTLLTAWNAGFLTVLSFISLVHKTALSE